MYDYTQCLARSEASRARTPRPREIRLLDADWLLLPEVFSPTDSRSSLAHLELIDFPVGGSFLEIGSGTGLIAVRAALAGCARVCATDVNPSAVRNTELNAARFGVASRVTSLRSDMFRAVPADATFDVIYWHSNNVWAPSAMTVESPLTLAYVDPGYDAHLRFFRDAPEHLAPGGRILLALSSRAGRAELTRLAAGAGQRLEPVKETTVTEPEGPVVYELMEVVPA